MLVKIPRCFDSHLHLYGIGEQSFKLDLRELSSVGDISKLAINKNFFREDWLVGFGWDEHKWVKPLSPNLRDLDSLFPNFPVFFMRADFHAAWVNTSALKRVPGSEVFAKDGIVRDPELLQFRRAIPELAEEQVKALMREACAKLNSQGFTHVRDLSCTRQQWKALRDLDLAGDLTLYVEEFFICEKLTELDQTLALARACRDQQTAHLRVSGIKFFLDGALGSEGAWLSQNYIGKDSSGSCLWEFEELKFAIKKSWEAGFEVACHAIGDAAADMATEVAISLLGKGERGVLNIEHGQVIQSKTIKKLALLKARVFMQPSHFLSDKNWLRRKLGSLYGQAFPWAELSEAGVSIHWGSDAPVEPASVARTMLALEESAAGGISKPPKPYELQFTHANTNWGQDCFSLFDTSDSWRPREIVFDGRNLLK